MHVDHGAGPVVTHALGRCLGPKPDPVVILRPAAGADAGLLSGYAPTWDVYAVIGTGLELAAVQAAFAFALKLGEPLAVEDFVALLPTQPAVHWSLGCEL